MIQPDSDNTVFRLAADFVNQTTKHVFLTGKAGTGKTTFLRYICKTSHKNILVAAPTGVAAINAGGVTLHSLFQLPFEPYIPGSRVKTHYRFGQAKLDLLREMEVLIIDEVSMLRADTLDCIDATLRFIRRNSLPFGGIQVLYIGDMFQLPPVVKDEEWELIKTYYPSPFFFYAKVLEKVPLIYLELKKVYRQKEQNFVDLLNRVRNNKITRNDIETLNSRYIPNFRPDEKEKYIILTTHNYQADAINSEKLAALSGKSFRFEGTIKKEFPNLALPTDLVLDLKVGAQVMFLRNDSSGRYYNGKLAEVVKLEEDNVTVLPIGAKDAITLEKDRWENIRFSLNKETGEIEKEILGEFIQYPIRVAWAITVHKSQGLTFERAIIEIGQAFAAGQAYVALSRCTSLEGIVLQSPINSYCILTDEHAILFSNNEKEANILEGILETSKKEFWTQRLQDYFDWKPLMVLLNEQKKQTQEKSSKEMQDAHTLFEKLFTKSIEQEQIAKRFQEQLKTLAINYKNEEDLAPIKERCQKAIDFFYPDLQKNILQPLQEHKKAFNIRRAKVYWKSLDLLEDSIILFCHRLTEVRFNNVPLIENKPQRLLKGGLFANEVSDEEDKSGKKTKPKSKNPQADISRNTKDISLEMFQKGMSVEEIAKDRSLAVSTIYNHLVHFIKTGKLNADKLVSKEKIESIRPLAQEMITTTNMSVIVPIKEKLGNDFSFDEIKAVWYQVLFENSTSRKE